MVPPNRLCPLFARGPKWCSLPYYYHSPVWSGQSRSDSRQSVTGRRTGTTLTGFPDVHAIRKRFNPTRYAFLFTRRPWGHELHGAPRPTLFLLSFLPSFLPFFLPSDSTPSFSKRPRSVNLASDKKEKEKTNSVHGERERERGRKREITTSPWRRRRRRRETRPTHRRRRGAGRIPRIVESSR